MIVFPNIYHFLDYLQPYDILYKQLSFTETPEYFYFSQKSIIIILAQHLRIVSVNTKITHLIISDNIKEV